MSIRNNINGFTRDSGNTLPLWARARTRDLELMHQQVAMTFNLFGKTDPYKLEFPSMVNAEPNRLQFEQETGQVYMLDRNMPTVMEMKSPNQIVQSFDGTGNNLLQATLGSSHVALRRKSAPAFYDGTSSLAQRGVSNPSPRAISNAVCKALSTPPESILNLSNMVWAWGQYIDHAITLTDTQPSDTGETAPMSTSALDPHEDFPNRTIPFVRSVTVNSASPRQQPNVISSFLDGTHIYGTTLERVYALRRKDGTGKMHTSTSVSGDVLLPLNTFGLSNANPLGADESTLFAGGDIRANENIFLQSLHTLFVREHNRLCDELLLDDNSLLHKDEMIFQRARHIVLGLIQNITFNSFLPALLGDAPLPVYTSYKPFVDPAIATEFSTVGYRLGHAMIPSVLRVGVDVSDTVLLRNTFFDTSHLHTNGIEGILRGSVLQRQNTISPVVVDDLRNHLFGAPTSTVMMDLAAFNIQRGRDHGIGGYNVVREAYGLSAATTFADMTSSVPLQTALASLYDSVGDVDPWVGALAEDHVVGCGTGSLTKSILIEQFTRTRDGDRFYFENNLCLTEEVVQEIHATSLKDIIVRNTTISESALPDNMFKVLP